MPQIILEATNAQATRIDEARVSYNTEHRTSLTTKQWIYEMLRQAVKAQLRSTTIEATARASLAAIDTDMQGGN